MPKIKFDVRADNGVAIDVTYDVLWRFTSNISSKQNQYNLMLIDNKSTRFYTCIFVLSIEKHDQLHSSFCDKIECFIWYNNYIPFLSRNILSLQV